MNATKLEPVTTRDHSGRGRAAFPSGGGFATSSDGVRIAYEVYGSGESTIMLLPSNPIVHSRQWKGQVPYLSRHFRVVTYDGRGNGRSERPTEPSAYSDALIIADLVAVMNATGTSQAILVGLCADSVWRAIRLAASDPSRVAGIVAFAIGVPLLSPRHPNRSVVRFEDVLASYDGWEKLNRHYWSTDYADFARFFFEAITTEPHSTKVIDDAVEWALDGSVDAMLADAEAGFDLDQEAVEAICRAVTCPMLIVHGTEDHCQPIARAQRLAQLTGAPLVVVEGADHMIPGRHPVLANLLIRDFVRSLEEGVS
jgi:pimeloyl-ACP methyl ester carboxylesterase